jgi:hypothetical protein
MRVNASLNGSQSHGSLRATFPSYIIIIIIIIISGGSSSSSSSSSSHNEELNDLYSSPNIVLVINSRRIRWAGHVARTGKRVGVYRVLVRKSEGKRLLLQLFSISGVRSAT